MKIIQLISLTSISYIWSLLEYQYFKEQGKIAALDLITWSKYLGNGLRTSQQLNLFSNLDSAVGTTMLLPFLLKL